MTGKNDFDAPRAQVSVVDAGGAFSVGGVKDKSMDKSMDPWAQAMLAVAESRDKQAFIALFDYFAPRINGYLQKLGLSPSLAEDMTQDVMSVIWLKADLFDPTKSSVTTWVYRVARNRRIDLVRRDRLDFFDPTTANPLDQTPDISQNDALEELDLSQREEIMRQALKSLPPEQRVLIDQSFFQGLSHGEIAQQTGLPLGTVKSRIRLAFARLRRALAEHGLSQSA